MNSRLKLLILVLLIAVLCLSAAIASLSLTDSGTQAEEPNPAATSGGSAITCYVQNGLWGVRSVSGRVLIEPTWYYLSPMNDKTTTDAVLIARQSDGKKDRFGLIRSNGEQLVPFLYSSFDAKASDVWLATLNERGKNRYHLYHSDGTRWMDESWDSVVLNHDMLEVTAEGNAYWGTLDERGVQWNGLKLVYPVGLHQLTMELGGRNGLLLPKDVLEHLGKAAADYLVYLFVTGEAPEAAMISAEDAAAVRKAYLYRNCTLTSAAVSRVKKMDSEGFPRYLVQMQVQYRRKEANGTMKLVDTAFYLTISRNTAGNYTYSSFSDSQLEALGES